MEVALAAMSGSAFVREDLGGECEAGAVDRTERGGVVGIESGGQRVGSGVGENCQTRV